MSEQKQHGPPVMPATDPNSSRTHPPFVPESIANSQYGGMRIDDRYLFGSFDEAVLFRSPEAKYRPGASPPQTAPNFTAIEAGATSKDLNAPGPPVPKYGPTKFSRPGRYSKGL